MLLSERKNKRYIIVLDQYDENLGRYIPKSHTVEAPTLVEAIINHDYFRRTSTANHPSQLLSVREARVYPQSFINADQRNMITVLKELARNHPDTVHAIDEFAETFQWNSSTNYATKFSTMLSARLSTQITQTENSRLWDYTQSLLRITTCTTLQ